MVGIALISVTLKKIFDFEAPSVCERIRKSRSTLRAPAMVFASTMKNVSESPSAIFDPTPRPNHRRKRGASATRGKALKAEKNGSKNFSAEGKTANSSPNAMPKKLPRANAERVALRVQAASVKIVPLVSAVYRYLAMPDGRPIKRGSIIFAVETHSQRAKKSTSATNCADNVFPRWSTS